jgi:glycine hydroxymethyltransferase
MRSYMALFLLICSIESLGKVKQKRSFISRIYDEEIVQLIEQEELRQKQGINLIASENYASQQVLSIAGSVLSNKYTEGYPGRRYYSGCEHFDTIEDIAISRFKKLFGAEHVNVQPHSGSQANMAVYFSLLQPGDTILSMDLSSGGHLSHGHPMNWTSSIYNIVTYGVDRKTYTLNYDEIEHLAKKHKPKLIIAGASAYPQEINFKKFAKIAKEVGAYFMADIAHIAGFVAAGLHQSPFPEADVVTMTTHKTFRGPRGGVIMCKAEFGKAIDKMIMPGLQGGALMNHIAGKAAACLEASNSDFVTYQQHVLNNAAIAVKELHRRGYKVITKGTKNHIILIDVLASKGMDGRAVEEVLEQVGIYVNRNTIPFDKQPPLRPSGIRIGTAAITTLGAHNEDMVTIIDFIDRAIKHAHDKVALNRIAQEVKLFMANL